jgi:hypothetical protein
MQLTRHKHAHTSAHTHTHAHTRTHTDSICMQMVFAFEPHLSLTLIDAELYKSTEMGSTYVYE